MESKPLPQRVPRLTASAWLWPAVLGLSTAAVGVLVAAQLAGPLRTAVAVWFLLVCPGMAWVRLLRIREPIAEWTLAVSLSAAIDAGVAGIMLYTRTWSAGVGLLALMAVTVLGTLLQLGEQAGWLSAIAAALRPKSQPPDN